MGSGKGMGKRYEMRKQYGEEKNIRSGRSQNGEG